MIEHCLPRPGRMEREWVLWVELWLRAVRHPALQDVAHELYRGCTRGSPPRSRRASSVASSRSTTSARRPTSCSARSTASGVRVLAGDPAMALDRARALLLGLASREVGAAVAEPLRAERVGPQLHGARAAEGALERELEREADRADDLLARGRHLDRGGARVGERGAARRPRRRAA